MSVMQDKGYTGNPYSEEGCSQTTGGDYNEGDEDNEEWNNYNELYCNSHGKYDTDTKRCLCYMGYTGDSCSECSANYLNFGGMCFRDLECPQKGNHLVQETIPVSAISKTDISPIMMKAVE